MKEPYRIIINESGVVNNPLHRKVVSIHVSEFSPEIAAKIEGVSQLHPGYTLVVLAQRQDSELWQCFDRFFPDQEELIKQPVTDAHRRVFFDTLKRHGGRAYFLGQLSDDLRKEFEMAEKYGLNPIHSLIKEV